MKIKIHKIDNMINNGENILKNLQNSVIDDLELLVRESIQNSLDASYEQRDIEIDFSLGKFRKEDLITRLEKTERLFKLYKNEYEDFISIKDMNTSGLTGPLSYKQVDNLNKQGNLLRLVYSMGNPQTQSGAGGSWGFGKTLYYRIGSGIVLYYTRIKNEHNHYEERIVGVLVENQNSTRSIIDHRKHKSTGIAWWGEYNNDNDIIPITNPQKIKEILDIFGINSFKGTETGTNIIIPFINKEKLYDEAVMNSKDADNFYMGEISEYLKYSIQRWYFPRLNNPGYILGKKNNLKVSINGDQIRPNDENKMFKILREMYNYAVTNNFDSLKMITKNKTLKREPITVQQVKNMNGNLVGNLVFGKFDYKELGMSTRNDISNPIFLSNTNRDKEDSDNSNPPMILYTRMPGMIVNYDSNSKWVSGLERTPKEEYIIGLFVLNSDVNVYFDIFGDNGNKLTLEDYIRSTELDDHMEWHNKLLHDINNKSFNPSIVDRIIRNTKNKIRNELYEKDKSGNQSDVTSHLGNLIGGMILPQIGYGNMVKSSGKGVVTTGSNDRRRGNRKIKYEIRNNEIQYGSNYIKIPFDFEFLDEKTNIFNIELLIVTESGKLSLNKYESFFNMKSPLYFEKITISSNEVNIKEIKTNIYNSTMKYEVNRTYKNVNYIKGDIVIITNDKNIIPEIKISGVDIHE